MLILYDKNHCKICGLVNYKDLNITREINKLDTLSFLYPITDKNYSQITEEGYIRTKDNEYVIKKIDYYDDNYDQITCEINVETIKGNPVSHFETKEQKCADAVNLALAGTGWTLGSCNVTKLRTVKKSNCGSYDVLSEIENIYKCDMTFDAINKKIYVYQSMGSDKGTYFSEQLNLKKVDTQCNTSNYITRLIPIGKNGLDITSVNNGCSYVENHQYSDKVITAYWSDNRYTVPQDLKDDAVERLKYLSKPQKNYSCDVYDLANISDKYKNILDYGLGDTITLLSKSRNVKEKQRIVKLVQYPDEPEKNTCEISNKLANIEDLITRFADTSDTVDDVTTSDNMLDGSKLDGIDTDNIGHVHIKIADIENLSTTIADIGTLVATKATITNLDAANAKIDNLTANKADVTDLTSSNARIKTLEGESASINTLLTKGLTAANMQAGFITADCGLIAKEAISDAMIKDLSVSKVLAGDISTNKFRIVSDSGNMLMSGNTIQIKDSSRVRVQIGKDASSDYNIYVWDASGNLMFDATGLKGAGIKDKIIRDDMVSDTANINGTKIEKESLVTQINGANTLLKASKVHLDTENQTLDLAFTSLKTTANNTASTVSNQGTAISTIQGQISSKIWQQDITTAVDGIQVGGRNLLRNSDFNDGLDSKWSYGCTLSIDDSLYLNHKIVKYTGNNSTVHDYIMQGISSNILKPNTTYTLSCYAKFQNMVSSGILGLCAEGNKVGTGYSNLSGGTIDWAKYIFTFTTSATLSGTYNIGWYFTAGVAVTGTMWLTCFKLEEGNKPTDWTPAPEDTQAQITTLNSNFSSLTQTVSGISSNVGSLQTQMNTANGNITSVTNKESSLEQTVNGLSSTISSVQQNYLSKSDAGTAYATITQVSSLSQTVSGLSSTVSSTKTEINGLQIGGRNLIQNSNPIYIWYCAYGATHNSTISTDTLNSYVNNIYITNVRTVHFTTNNTGDFRLSHTWGSNSDANTTFTPLINRTFTFSTWVKTDAAVTLSLWITDTTDEDGGTKAFSLSANSWTEIILTHTFTSSTNTGIRVRFTLSGTANVSMCLAKLEEGTKATDWTPAPEDTQSQIDGATTRISSCESNISQQAGLIASKVSSTDFNGNNLVSMINQSSSKISMSALNIDLSGYVSFTNLNTSGATHINADNITTGTLTGITLNGVTINANNIITIGTNNNSENPAIEFKNSWINEIGKTSIFTIPNAPGTAGSESDTLHISVNSSSYTDMGDVYIGGNGNYSRANLNVNGDIISLSGWIYTDRICGKSDANIIGLGSSNGSNKIDCSGGTPRFSYDNSTYIQVDNGVMRFYVGGSNVAGVTGSGLYGTSSIAMKKNIAPVNLDYAYNLVHYNMTPYSYQYIGSDEYSWGVLAEESPDEITVNNKKAINQYSYTTVILAALKRAQEKIDVLEQEVSKLKSAA